jgi:hypothetical protein
MQPPNRSKPPLVFIPDNGRGDTNVTLDRQGNQAGQVRICRTVEIGGRAALGLTDAVRNDELPAPDRLHGPFMYHGRVYRYDSESEAGRSHECMLSL